MASLTSVLIQIFLFAAAASASEDSWQVVSRVWDHCISTEDKVGCLKGRALAALDRAVKSDIHLGDMITIQRTREDNGRSLTDNEIKEGSTDMIWDRLARFLSNHIVKVQLPKVTPEELKQGAEEGRGKMKKMMGSMMMLGAMKAAMIIPLVIGGLFLLAGKAFIISKIALVLALVITAKKLFGKSDEGHSGGHGGGWDRRSLTSHDLVYSAHKPANRV